MTPLRIRGRAFRPRASAFAVAALVCAAAVSLGNWQMRRATERTEAGARLEAALRAPARSLPAAPFDPASYAHTMVRASGTFVASQTYFLDNRPRQGRPGYEVLSALRIAGSDVHVLVVRGWLPAAPRREALPSVRTGSGEQVVEGLAITQLSRALEPPGYAGEGRLRQNMSIDQFSAATGLRMLPVAIEQRSPSEDGLDRNWPNPASGADKNTAYALQWYALGALAVVLLLVLSFRREDHGKS